MASIENRITLDGRQTYYRSRYTCLIKHAETLLRTKDCCTHSFIKLLLLHSKKDMICFAKPGLTQDFYIEVVHSAKGRIINNILYYWSVLRTLVYTWQRPSLFVTNKTTLSSVRILHKDCQQGFSCNGKISVHESQGAWPQEELIGSKPPVIK
jgi:hypothetical protein